MRRFHWVIGTIAVGMMLIAAGPSTLAEEQVVQTSVRQTSSRPAWNQRVLRPASTSNQNRKTAWSAYRPGQFGQQVQTVSQHAEPLLSDEPALVEGDPLIDLGTETYGGDCATCGPGESCDSCGPCDTCGEACGPGGCGSYYECGSFARAVAGLACHVLMNLNYHAGVQGFKGPTDLGRNGNFGFHYGLTWGSPLGDPWGLGYQFGVNVVHSNFSGDRITDVFSSDNRDQVFLTSGIFHRAMCGGLQWGIVYDLMQDSYRDDATLGQIRTEISLVRPGCREVGFWGAFGVTSDRLQLSLIDQVLTDLDVAPIDIYAAFYRRYFTGGGQGRVWAGLTDQGDAILGADATVPLGTSWSLENTFTYMVPESGQDNEGQQREGWNVALRLVWYPGREASCEIRKPYAPLMMTADNGSMIIDARNP